MTAAARRATLIANPVSGGGSRRRVHQLEQAKQILHDAGYDAELAFTAAPGGATALARRAVEEGHDLVLVAGGDGTFNEVVNGLAGSQVPLALLPAGTANVMGQELGLPTNIPEAVRMALRGTPRRIALGQAIPARGEPRYFLALGGAGPDGALVNGVNLKLKLKVGILAYWWEGLRQLFLYKFPRLRIVSGERTEEASLVIVGRTKHYGGAFRITTGADLREDRFELFTFQAAGWFGYLAAFPSLLLNTLRNRKDVRYWTADRVRCEPADGQRVLAQIDGEPFGELPMEFRIVPGALTLVFPETAGAPRA